MPVDDQLTFLQFSRKGKPDCLVARHLGDGVAEEDELVIWLAHILAFLVGGHLSHCD